MFDTNTFVWLLRTGAELIILSFIILVLLFIWLHIFALGAKFKTPAQSPPQQYNTYQPYQQQQRYTQQE